jgi:transposase-like protein
MEAFIGEGIITYFDRFKTDMDCLAYLAEIKNKNAYKCCKCGHNKFTVRKKNFATDCNRCHHIESPTAGTMFHKVKIGVRKAFSIIFEMSATTKSMSARQISKRYEISYPAAWLFTHKVRNSMKSSELYPMTGTVIVDEFVFGGKENLKQGRSTDSKKKKIVAAVELSDTGGIKRVYFETIKDYSSQSLESIFEKHISTQAKVQTDKWSGYKPLTKKYNITQIKSDKGKTFFEMNTVVHQTKAWLRSTFSWMHSAHIQLYLNEFSYRINRSIHKQSIFDNLINRMIEAKPLTYKDIALSN